MARGNMGTLVILLISFLVILLHVTSSSPIPGTSNHTLVFLMSFDGFRHDYFKDLETPNFDRLIANGALVPEVENIFITKTFPNHHTIVTGLYAETHNVVANEILNPHTNELVNMFGGSSAAQDLINWNPDISPIWIQNQVHDPDTRISGVSMWPGDVYTYGGLFPVHVNLFNRSETWKNRLDTALAWMTDAEDPANLVVFYIEEPDSKGHDFGPWSREVKQVVQEIDEFMGYLEQSFRNAGLWDRVNLIVTSDHGMEATPPDNLIPLIHKDLYQIGGTTPIHLIYPRRASDTEFLLQAFQQDSADKNYTVYARDSIPERFHYSNSELLPPILLVADLGWNFDTAWWANWTDDQRHSMYGQHGWDNTLPSMHPFLLGHGPLFKQGYVWTPSQDGEPFQSVDIYPLLCHMLDITPKPHNGSLAVSSTLLRNPPFQKRFDWGHPVISSDGDSNAQPSDSQSSLHMQQYEILLSDDAARLRDRPLIASAQGVNGKPRKGSK